MSEIGGDRLSRYEQPLPCDLIDGENDLVKNATWKKLEYKSEPITPGPIAPVLLTVTLFLVAALTIFVATWLLWELQWWGGPLQIVLSAAFGMLLSLPVLISIWIVLGGQTWIIRIPLASLYLVALFGTFFTALKSNDEHFPDDLFWVFGGIVLAISAAIQTPLWIVRAWRRVSISRTGSESTADKQFTIKQLLISTTIFAFLVPLLGLFGPFEFTTQTRVPLDEAFAFFSVVVALLLFLTLLSLLFVFSHKLRLASLCVLAVGLAAIPYGFVPLTNYMMRQQISDADWMMALGMNAFAFASANAVMMIVVLSLYYAVGFRLRRKQVG